MKKHLFFAVITASVIFSACSKDSDPAPVTPVAGEPKKGSTWVFKNTYFDQNGTVTNTENYTLIADTATLNGSVWLLLKETVSNQVLIGLQKRTDGWWSLPLPNPNPSLWFKNPAAVGDQYNLNVNDNTVDLMKIVSINSTLTVPAGTYTGCTFSQSYDSNSMEDEWYFTTAGPVLLRNGTFDDKIPAGTGIYEKERMELVSYTQ